MRFFSDSLSLMSEIFRDLDEMGQIVKPKSYQNKVIEGNNQFFTKEIQMYSYALTDLPDKEYLFLFEGPKAYEWCKEEFKERVSDKYINPGKAWEIRKELWEPFLNDKGKFDYTYNGRLMFRHNLERIIVELKRNPDSRQGWLPIFFPEDVSNLGGKKRIPCSLGYHFMVRMNKLDMVYIQRSADAVNHFGNDIYLAWLMKEYVAKRLGVEPGYLFHTIFSLHAYAKDWERLAKGMHDVEIAKNHI